MLTVLGNAGEADCGRTTRRDFLRVGALGLGGLSLASLMATAARAGVAGEPSPLTDKAVVLLFLCGGASHIETFDPKMTAPLGCRSVTGEVRTSIPGVTFGGTFPKLAKLANRLAVVRSYQPHANADHAQAIHLVFTAGRPTGGSIGAATARLRGGSYLPNGVPAYASLIDQREVDSQYREDQERMTKSDSAGSLGPACAPFRPEGTGQLEQDMRLGVPLERLNDRLALRASLDRLRRSADTGGAMDALDENNRRAVEVILGDSARKALDLSAEDPRTREAYDTSEFLVGHKSKGPCTLGERLLLARRLCEAGCRFVTVGMAGWDNHGNGNHPGVADGMRLLGGPLDHAVAAFLEDVARRGLSEKILLVITSEFGRTPRIDPGGGRDHWPGLCPLAFAGGGLRIGQVIGQSAPRLDEPHSEPIRMSGLTGTILHTLFDTGALRLRQGLPGEVMTLLDQSEPIRELV